MKVQLEFEIPDEQYNNRWFGHTEHSIEFLLSANHEAKDFKWNPERVNKK